jgi:hypothetical protein
MVARHKNAGGRRKSAGRKPADSRSTDGKSTGRKSSGAKDRRWSARVTRESDALDLEQSVFKSSDPRRIALSLKRSAERSKRRKSAPYRSAMSMLTFYMNRAGKNLPQRQFRVLERAKGELRKVFGRE